MCLTKFSLFAYNNLAVTVYNISYYATDREQDGLEAKISIFFHADRLWFYIGSKYSLIVLGSGVFPTTYLRGLASRGGEYERVEFYRKRMEGSKVQWHRKWKAFKAAMYRPTTPGIPIRNHPSPDTRSRKYNIYRLREWRECVKWWKEID